MTETIVGSFPLKYTDDLDPTHFHCIRYIGPIITGIDKTSTVYYFFKGLKTSFVASMAFTWSESEGVLILPLWMKRFGLVPGEQLRVDKIGAVEEFAGKLILEFFGDLDQPSLPFDQLLPELLGDRRPLSNGTVLPFCWNGRRSLVKVKTEETGERDRVFWFDLENGTLDIKIPQMSPVNFHLISLLKGSWSDEFKILKHHLTHSADSQKQIILVCGVPVPLQRDLVKVLEVEDEAVDVSAFISEEHLQIQEDEGEEEEDKSLRYKLIGEVDKISSSLMTEILRKFSHNPHKLLLITSARSIETSVQLIQLEKSAHRFNFQINSCTFPLPSEPERLQIVGSECDGEILIGCLEEFKWSLNSMSIVDLMRLGRIYRSFSQTDGDKLKRAIDLIKETEAESSSNSSLFTILTGKTGNFRFYGYKSLKKEFKDLIKGPLVYPEAYERFGLPKSSGFLIHGPTGCGKTTLCLNILTSHPFSTFFTVFHVSSASQLLSKYFGETEANIRKLFTQARERKPSIIFIDQIETLGRKRGLDSGSDSEANDRYLSTLLNEMDGISGNEGVTVIACANRIDFLDEALLRPGRLDRHFLIDLPDFQSREEIFDGYSNGQAVEEEILNESDGWTGADIKKFFKRI